MAKSINKKDKKGKKNKQQKILQCPCGGGQSCIVDRRRYNDWVHEDDVLRQNGLSVRTNCHTPFTIEQEAAMSTFFARMSDEGFTSISK